MIEKINSEEKSLLKIMIMGGMRMRMSSVVYVVCSDLTCEAIDKHGLKN